MDAQKLELNKAMAEALQLVFDETPDQRSQPHKRCKLLDNDKLERSSRLQGLSARKNAENSALNNEVFVNQSVAHAELIATFRRAEVDAAHKFGLIKAAENKGPKTVQAAIETAVKAAKRRDSYAQKLTVLGVILKG